MAEPPPPRTRNPWLVLVLGVPVVIVTWLFFQWLRGEPFVIKEPLAEDKQTLHD